MHLYMHLHYVARYYRGLKMEWANKIEFPLVTSVGRLFKRRFHDIVIRCCVYAHAGIRVLTRSKSRHA